jgi:photosystem II stability/assembly factor-like uncharacterized protein
MRALILLLCLVCSPAWADDWTTIPLGSSADLYAIGNTGVSNRWVVGEGGFAARSNADRTAWTIIDAGTNANLYSVSQPGMFEVFMGAGGGTVRLRIYNGWFERDIPSQFDFRLFTRQSGNCVAVGPEGLLFHTTDYGNTWDQKESGTTAELNAGVGVFAGPAWVVGNDGTILRTTDGNTWTQIGSGTTADLYGTAVLDLTNIYAAGEAGTILKSTDAGLTWSERPSGATQTLRAISISKNNGNIVIAVGLGGTVLRSTDAGASWCHLDVPMADFYAAEAVSDTEFVVGGAGGLLLRTTNGGGPCVVPSGVDLGNSQTLTITALSPQPCRDSAMLRLSVDRARSFQTDVFDPSGRRVLALPKTWASAAGEHTITLSTGGLAAGLYFVAVRSDGFEATRRFVVLR